MNIKLLEWDTNLFGYKVGKITIGHNPSPEEINQVKKEAEGFKLVYLFSNHPIYLLGEASDIKFILTKKVYPADTINSEWPLEITEYNSESFDDLLNLSFQSGLYSRYKTDKNFVNDEFKKLYTLWLTKSIEHEIADIVLIAKNNKSILGFITLKKNKGGGEIGLIAVNEQYRGRGLGKKLLQKADAYALKHNWNYIDVATQEINLAAVRLYTSAEYIPKSKTFIYHLWQA